METLYIIALVICLLYFLRYLFNESQPSKEKKAFKGAVIATDVEKITDDMLCVDSINFCGPFTTSPNKKFTLAWCESDWSNKKAGKYILLDNNKLILQGALQRPNHGKIANCGNFIINDLMFGQELNGTFYAFTLHGDLLVKKHYQANLFNNGISSDGKFAVCQTCNSDNADGGTLSFFDLQKGLLLWQKEPEVGWSQSYEFDSENERLYLIVDEDDSEKFSYNFSGEFLDYKKLEKKKMQEASGFELSQEARKRFKALGKNIDNASGNEILSILRTALGRDLDRYPNEKAKIHRTMGEVFEAIGKKAKAITNYEKALKLNPKIGVRRKLDILKKH